MSGRQDDWHTAPTVWKQRVLNAATQLAFPFPLVWNPTPWNDASHTEGSLFYFRYFIQKLPGITFPGDSGSCQVGINMKHQPYPSLHASACWHPGFHWCLASYFLPMGSVFRKCLSFGLSGVFHQGRMRGNEALIFTECPGSPFPFAVALFLVGMTDSAELLV